VTIASSLVSSKDLYAKSDETMSDVMPLPGANAIKWPK